MFSFKYGCRLSCSLVEVIKANAGMICSRNLGVFKFNIHERNSDLIYLTSTGRPWRSALILNRIGTEWTKAYDFFVMTMVSVFAVGISIAALFVHGTIRPRFILFAGLLVLLWVIFVFECCYFGRIFKALSQEECASGDESAEGASLANR